MVGRYGLGLGYLLLITKTKDFSTPKIDFWATYLTGAILTSCLKKNKRNVTNRMKETQFYGEMLKISFVFISRILNSPDKEFIILETPSPVLVAHAVHLVVLGPGYQQDPANKCRIVVLSSSQKCKHGPTN